MISRLICWLIGHDSPRIGTPATDFTCKRCGRVPEYCVVSRWKSERGGGLVHIDLADPDSGFYKPEYAPKTPAWTKWRELGYASPDDYFEALAKAVKEE